jgi:spermidine/putrescine transport system substrate-binding protein
MSVKRTSIDEMIEKAAERKLSRRQFNQLLAVTGISLFAAPMFVRSAAAAGDDELLYFTWGGYDVPELFGQYREKHGKDPRTAVFESSNEGLAKVLAGYVVDVIHPCNVNVPVWIEDGAIQPLDTSKLSHWKDMIPSLKTIGTANGKHYFAAMDWGQTSITYRKDIVDFPDGEESWGILWDERYKGKIAMLGNEGDAWWCAAIYAGIPFEQIHTDESIEKVAELMRKQRPLVRLYTDDMTSVEQALASGELVAAMTWNASPTRLKAKGVPVEFAVPKNGALTWVCGASIYKDAPRVDKAHDLIDSLLSPESGRFLINDYGYGHSNKKSFDLVSEERLAELGLSRDPEKVLGAGKYQIPVPAEFSSKIAILFSEIKSGF